uniref:Uncharacterized protein n=1 Tax=Rhizophora mucronata TaxID=61149 RepID=A0A2P2QES6_RHIMU
MHELPILWCLWKG